MIGRKIYGFEKSGHHSPQSGFRAIRLGIVLSIQVMRIYIEDHNRAHV